MTPQQARATLAILESSVGARLGDMPVSYRDQWSSHLRDMLADLDVDVTEPCHATAAFAGAYMMATLLLPVAAVPRMNAAIAVQMLRDLADRADEQPPDPVPPVLPQVWPLWE